MHPSEIDDDNTSPPITKSVSRISQDETISWYHGKITRDAAEHILKISGEEEGQFLVRESTTSPGDYVLSLIHDGQPIHYQIRRHGEDAFFNIDEGPIIHGLEVLINHYQDDAQGLSTKLSKMCKGQPPPHDTRRHGRTNLLHRATREGDITVVGELLKSGYHNLDAKNQGGQTAVHLASIIGQNEILIMLLQAGANVNILDSSGLTPLHNQKIVSNHESDSYFAPNLIRRESLKIGLPIGEGEFGSVLKGKWTNFNNIQIEVAVKTLRDEQLQSGREEFIREVEVMVGLDHSCIVRLLGVCLGPPLMMVQELIPMGSVLDYLIDYPNEIEIDFDLKLWAAQIACGMMYLESKRFVHRDLAARNILLATKHQAKISDFGLSRALRVGSEYYKATSGGRWPVKWYAPESVNYGTFSHASDVWSYGITLWEMFSLGEQPYGEMNGSQVIQLVENNRRLAQPKHCPNKVYAIMIHCWEYLPEKRPSFSQLYHIFNTDTEYASIWDLFKSS